MRVSLELEGERRRRCQVVGEAAREPAGEQRRVSQRANSAVGIKPFVRRRVCSGGGGGAEKTTLTHCAQRRRDARSIERRWRREARAPIGGCKRAEYDNRGERSGGCAVHGGGAMLEASSGGGGARREHRAAVASAPSTTTAAREQRLRGGGCAVRSGGTTGTAAGMTAGTGQASGVGTVVVAS